MWSIFLRFGPIGNLHFQSGLSVKSPGPLKKRSKFSLTKGTETRHKIRGLYLSYCIVGIIKNKMNFPGIFLCIIFR
jgi:hypothetical protein